APLKAVAFSGDGKSAYWAFHNGTAGYLHVTKVPNDQTGLVEKGTVYAFPVHAERVAVSARGNVVALGAADGTLSLWDAATIRPGACGTLSAARSAALGVTSRHPLCHSPSLRTATRWLPAQATPTGQARFLCAKLPRAENASLSKGITGRCGRFASLRMAR